MFFFFLLFFISIIISFTKGTGDVMLYICKFLILSFYVKGLDIHEKYHTVKPVLGGHRIKRTPSIKRTVAKVPKFISLIHFK